MRRFCLILLLTALAAWGANFKLYLKDGTFQLVREYKVEGDRVRFFTVERSEWEEIPASLVDLQKTEAERKERQQELEKEAEQLAAEDKLEREQREERERVPVEPGLYFLEGGQLRTIKQAECKVVTKKGRSVLKKLSPIPIVTGKATVELDGTQSANVVTGSRPEFYFRQAKDERISLVRLAVKKSSRVVQEWEIIPVTNDVMEKEEDVPTFRRQVDEGLFKIWPEKPLEPGQYAMVEYTANERNVQTWDFTLQAK